MLNSLNSQQHQAKALNVNQHLSIEQLLRAAKLIEQRAIIEKLPPQFEIGENFNCAKFGGFFLLIKKKIFFNLFKERYESRILAPKIRTFVGDPNLGPSSTGSSQRSSPLSASPSPHDFSVLTNLQSFPSQFQQQTNQQQQRQSTSSASSSIASSSSFFKRKENARLLSSTCLDENSLSSSSSSSSSSNNNNNSHYGRGGGRRASGGSRQTRWALIFLAKKIFFQNVNFSKCQVF
jgi:hypothetical protein